MNNDSHEKEIDDEVYEDDYYDEHYNEEELKDESDTLDDDDEKIAKGNLSKNDDDDDDDDDDWENKTRITRSFACEECDYRWDDTIIKNTKGNLEDEEDEVFAICPMCGSENVTQI